MSVLAHRGTGVREVGKRDVPDQRRHGEPDRPECCYTLEDFAADVEAFMDAVGIEVATFVGHSMGVLIAQEVALSHPRRVSRLVLIGASTMISGMSVFLLWVAWATPTTPRMMEHLVPSFCAEPIPIGGSSQFRTSGFPDVFLPEH